MNKIGNGIKDSSQWTDGDRLSLLPEDLVEIYEENDRFFRKNEEGDRVEVLRVPLTIFVWKDAV